MATTSSHLFNTRRTLSGLLRRRLVTAGSTTFGMLGRLAAEYGRAVAAAQRYDKLEHTDALELRREGVGAGIPRTIFEEFYGDRAALGWREA